MEKIVESRYAFRGRVLNLRVDTVELPTGKTSVREVAEHRGSVAMIPLDEQGSVTLVRQWRAAPGRMMLEIPAGTLEPDEAPEAGAPRELQEETGLTAGRLEFLVRFFPSPGVLTEEMFLYLARDLTIGQQHLMDDEDIEVVRLPLAEAIARIATGEIADAKTIIGLLLTREKVSKI